MIYQIQQSGQSCPKCSRKYNNISQSSSSSQSEYEQVIIPLRKHVVQHNQNIQQTLNILQQEVERLKTQNDEKDKQISKLRFDMRDYLSKKMPSFPTVGKIYDSPDLAAKTQNFLQGKPEKKKKKKKVEQSSEDQERDDGQFSNELSKKMKTLNKIKIDEIEKLLDEVSYYQEQYMKIRQKLDVCLDEIEWMEKFCNSFSKMGDKIAEIQGDKLIKSGWSLRKKTKVTWKYVKEFISQVLS